ncbi:hypothetical protein LSTR_LSTR013295 [Laodelphax striatellus]|uniref:Prolyl 4-hydroxylase alpha-subunit N-terminal domain-containing protein n=1 Tax=Laodelphax striatellus TaxID=195883 RepID=A0A482XCH4_LAOST|nr:hypothetical protein LSTR_LSTR013295 [Laodelphax striatellus]
MRWLLFVVVYLCSGVLNGSTLLGDDDGEGNNLSETVKVLKSKVDALFDRRQEDFRLLEEAFRTTLEKNLDLVSLREEVARLNYPHNFLLSWLRGGLLFVWGGGGWRGRGDRKNVCRTTTVVAGLNVALL